MIVRATTWMDLKGIILSENNPVSESYVLRDRTFITFLQELSCRKREQISHCQGLGVGVDIKE